MRILENTPAIDLKSFMEKPLFAHLATSCPDGPRDSPVWCIWRNDSLWICADIKSDSFLKRLMNDGRCALNIVDFDKETRRIHHVGFRGIAQVVAFDKDIAISIFTKYLGSDQNNWPQWFGKFLSNADARLVKIIPE